MAELECHLAFAHCESQDREAKATVAWVEGQRVVEQATTTEQGLEERKDHQVETEVGLRTSLVDTEVVF